MQGTVRKTEPKAWRKPRAEGCPFPPGTNLEPPRAGKDPDRRPEEMLERRVEGRVEGRGREGGARVQEGRDKRNE